MGRKGILRLKEKSKAACPTVQSAQNLINVMMFRREE